MPYKLQKKSYTTLEKVQEIRKSLSDTSTVSSVIIDKWKEKIKRSLFQDDHIQYYSGSKKNKFFSDFDNVLTSWHKETKPSDEELRNKCQEIAGFGEDQIQASESWIQAFKSHHQLG